MKDNDVIKKEIKKLIFEQKIAILSTCNEGFPYANIIAFSCSDNLKEIIFVTPRATTKFSNLLSNPQAAILIDNRSNIDIDFYNTIAVTAIGKTDFIHTADDKEKYSSDYTLKYPNLKDFINSPDSAIVRLRVQRYIMVSNFQNVSVIEI